MPLFHYSDVMIDTMASRITSFTIIYLTPSAGADQRVHQSSAPLAFVRGIHRWPVNSQHKEPVTRKMFPFDDVMILETDISAPFIKYVHTLQHFRIGVIYSSPSPSVCFNGIEAIIWFPQWSGWTRIFPEGYSQNRSVPHLSKTMQRVNLLHNSPELLYMIFNKTVEWFCLLTVQPSSSLRTGIDGLTYVWTYVFDYLGPGLLSNFHVKIHVSEHRF